MRSIGTLGAQFEVRIRNAVCSPFGARGPAFLGIFCAARKNFVISWRLGLALCVNDARLTGARILPPTRAAIPRSGCVIERRLRGGAS
jgi:hypothetical protein